MPFINEGDLYADTSGIRPKLQGADEDFRDFIIKDEAENGLPAFVNLIGIESPGLTASCAIAKFVKALIKKYLN
jgi:L-2-hydroxyglutarate oxidase LhgO